MFIINCKNYNEISGEKNNKLSQIAEKISKKYKIPIAIAPPHHLLASIKKSKLLVFAQHLDDAKIGSTTGYMIPEIVKKSKVNGALINHSEHRISSKEIINLVKRLKKLKMKTVVCVKNVREAEKYAKLNISAISSFLAKSTDSITSGSIRLILYIKSPIVKEAIEKFEKSKR